MPNPSSPFPESEYRYYVKRCCGLKLVARTRIELRQAVRDFGDRGHWLSAKNNLVPVEGLTWGKIHRIPEASND